MFKSINIINTIDKNLEKSIVLTKLNATILV